MKNVWVSLLTIILMKMIKEPLRDINSKDIKKSDYSPPSHTTHDRRYAEAETVMKHYVDRHAVYPTDSARLIPNLVLKANQKRGNYLQVESRLKNLAEQLKEISLASGLGWDVYLDEHARQFVFDVQAGKNLTRNQQTYPPVVLQQV